MRLSRQADGGDLNEGAPKRVTASFETADDLLWQAVSGRLPQFGVVTLARSGRIGPLVELAMATTALPDAYCGVVVEPLVFHQVERALRDGSISGAGARDRARVFPLSRVNLSGADADRPTGSNGPSTPRTPRLQLG